MPNAINARSVSDFIHFSTGRGLFLRMAFLDSKDPAGTLKAARRNIARAIRKGAAFVDFMKPPPQVIVLGVQDSDHGAIKFWDLDRPCGSSLGRIVNIA